MSVIHLHRGKRATVEPQAFPASATRWKRCLWDFKRSPPSMTKRASPDIQNQLRRHLNGSPAERRKIEATVMRNEARKLARLVALEGLKLAKAGKRVAAAEKLAEAEFLEQEWRKLGGKGPLT